MESRYREASQESDLTSPVAYQQGTGIRSSGKSIGKYVAIVLAVAMLFVIVVGTGFWLIFFADGERKAVEWAITMTEAYYYPEGFSAEAVYETAGPDADTDTLIQALNSQLDPYSEFMKPREFQTYIDQGAGHNRGIGVSFAEETVGETVYYKAALIVTNSPAERAGIGKGMYLLGYGLSETEMTVGVEYDAFSEFLSGQNGSFYLRFGYSADGTGARNYSLAREDYQATYCYYRDSETAFYFHGKDGKTFEEVTHPIEGLDDVTAYIRIDEFSGNVAEEFKACLNKMKERGREHLVLDLRTNGGGYLTDFQSIASHLLRNAQPGSKPLVQVARYKDGHEDRYEASEASDFEEYFSSGSQVYVLADENTASASECLIGTLVDYGTVPYDHIYLRQGEDGVAKSYGKGIMQASYQHYTGAAMKMTIAGVFWPLSDRSIHNVGVTTADGAHAIEAQLFWGEQDTMLDAVLREICHK